MGVDVRYNGTLDELKKAVSDLPLVFAGMMPDTSGAVTRLKMRIGRLVLRKVYEAFQVKADGGTGEDGIKWKELKASTLGLISKERSEANVARLQEQYKTMTPQRKALWQKQGQNLANMLFKKDEKSRRAALNILEKQRASGRITQSHYESTLSKLKLEQDASQKLKEATTGGFSRILVETERLLQSFSPDSGENVLVVQDNCVEAGSLVPYAKYHQSADPRKTNKDGEPILPRRQIFPDDEWPDEWRKAVFDEIRATLKNPQFWRDYLGGKAS